MWNIRKYSSDYEVVKGRMDDVFLAVTGKTLGGEHQMKASICTYKSKQKIVF